MHAQTIVKMYLRGVCVIDNRRDECLHKLKKKCEGPQLRISDLQTQSTGSQNL